MYLGSLSSFAVGRQLTQVYSCPLVLQRSSAGPAAVCPCEHCGPTDYLHHEPALPWQVERAQYLMPVVTCCSTDVAVVVVVVLQRSVDDVH